MEVNDSGKHSSFLRYKKNVGRKMFYSSGRLDYKKLQTCNLQKMVRFCSKLVSFLLSIFFTSLENTLAYYRKLQIRQVLKYMSQLPGGYQEVYTCPDV